MAELMRLRGRTSDPGEADELLLAADGHFGFSSDPGAGFLFDMFQEGDDDLIVAKYAIGGQFENSGEFDDFCVATVMTGSYGWEIDGRRGDGVRRPFLMRPGHDFRCVADDITLANFYLSPRALREVARTSYGDDGLQVVFDSPEPISERHSAHLLSLATVAAEYLESGTFRNPLVRASLFHTLAVSTLESFRLSSDPRERSRMPGDQLARFRRAVDFIDAHASLPITVGDIAAASGGTVSQLDAVFRERTGYSVAGSLQRARLDAARRELLSAPGAVDLDALAARWGFPDAGLFARRYRQAFHEGPAETVAL